MLPRLAQLNDSPDFFLGEEEMGLFITWKRA